MKELSIEQKARRYDEAIKVAKSNYETIVQMDNDCTFAKEGIVNTFHHIFPELKESEDERIRKWLINTIKSVPNNSIEWEIIDKSDVLTWLEKQGKQKPIIIPKFKIGDIITEDTGVYPHKKIEAIENENYIVRCLYTNSQQYISINTQDEYMLIEQNPESKFALEAAKEEKIDNQNCVKPADKVEPKFKVGDILVSDEEDRRHIYKVNAITNYDTYLLLDLEDGYTRNESVYTSDLAMYLWTIEDAKDGDILSNRYSIVIFRRIGNEKWNDVIDYHIGLFTNNQHLVVQKSLSHWGIINEVSLHPATKEQRGQLEKAMSNAGYTFDFEKKKIKEDVIY